MATGKRVKNSIQVDDWVKLQMFDEWQVGQVIAIIPHYAGTVVRVKLESGQYIDDVDTNVEKLTKGDLLLFRLES